MPRRKTPRFEVVKTKLPVRTRRSAPGGRWRSGPHRPNRDRTPEIELDEAAREKRDRANGFVGYEAD